MRRDRVLSGSHLGPFGQLLRAGVKDVTGDRGAETQEEKTMDAQQVLTKLNFGRVDGETDTRFDNCFIGTEVLRQVLLPQHALVVGNKGSGKSAICRLLCDDLQKVKPLLPKNFDEIYTVPAYGLQNEEFLPELDLLSMEPETVDDFRHFWMLYLGLKIAMKLSSDDALRALVEESEKERLVDAYDTLDRILVEVGLKEEKNLMTKLKYRFTPRSKPGKGKERAAQRSSSDGDRAARDTKPYNAEFRKKTGLSIVALMESVDTVLQESNRCAWIMLDKLDLLYVDDVQRLRASITGLVQLLVQYGNQFKNVHFKIFLRNDIYRQLHIVNKSHLVTYSVEMRWRGPLLLKLLVARAVVDQHVQKYCENVTGETVDVTNVILGTDEYVHKLFTAIFEPTMGNANNVERATPTDQWILRRLIDGTESSFPRELIHLGNKAVEKQREMNRIAGRHTSSRLISGKALREAFEEISAYRCDTYLYSEFPHLAKHFDVFRGSDTSTFHREELTMLFEPLSLKGDDAIRAVYDTGLLLPLGKNVDSSRKFKVPLLYRAGLGMSDRRHQAQHDHREKRAQDRSVQRPRTGDAEEDHSVLRLTKFN